MMSVKVVKNTYLYSYEILMKIHILMKRAKSKRVKMEIFPRQKKGFP